MNILTYIHIRRATGQTTGVARHAIRMIRGLVDRHHHDVHLLGSREEHREQLANHPNWALADRPMHTSRFSRAILERVWYAAGRPRADRYWPAAQWVYVPNEAYVPVGRAKVAFTVHDLDYLEPDLPWSGEPGVIKARRAWYAKLRPMMRRADVVLAVSEFTRRRIVELLGVNERKIVVVGNGVDERFFRAAEQEHLSAAANAPDVPYLLHIGALMDKKGAGYVIALAKLLHERRSPVQVWISGRIDEKYSPAVAAAPNIRALGFVPDEQIIPMMQKSLALILLSRYEGFGMPPLEAMAVGVPAVVSHFASLPEVVGNAGVIVDPTDPASGVDAVDRLLRDPGHRSDLIARGRVRARSFTWDACVDRLHTALT